MTIKRSLEEALSKIGIGSELIGVPSYEFGDFSLNLNQVSKILQKTQDELIESITQAIPPNKFSVNRLDMFINFRVNDENIFTDFEHEHTTPRNGKTVVLDYSSPNIAKPFSISHLRSTLLGNAIANVYEERGWKTIRINHLGDWGTQFGKLLTEYKESKPQINDIRDLFQLYVNFHDKAKRDPSLEDRARREFARLEEGDEENLKLWRQFRDISLSSFNRVYSELGITFDTISGESESLEKIESTLKLLKERSILIESEGALIVNLANEGIETPALLLKKDRSSLYLLRDLATAIDRMNRYSFDKMIYEVGSEQELHFRQLFSLLKLTGHSWCNRCNHVSHGLYNFEGKKMSTREGRVVFFDDLLEITEKEARTKMDKILFSDYGPGELDDLARKIAISAIIFNDLKTDRGKDVIFNPEKINRFEGDTGPYIEYTRARITSIIGKSSAEADKSQLYWTMLTNSERRLARTALIFEDSIDNSLQSNKPHFVARSLLLLANEFNSYYVSNRVIGSGNEKSKIRFLKRFRDYIDKGLCLLGMPLLDRV